MSSKLTRATVAALAALVVAAAPRSAGAQEASPHPQASPPAKASPPAPDASPPAPDSSQPAALPHRPEDAPPLPEWGRMGLFEISDPFILAELRLEPYARSPRTLEPLEVELGARGVWENDYGWGDSDRSFVAGTQAPHRLTLDGETRDLDLVARVGVFPRVELGAELTTLHWRGGGILDPMIAEYHRAVGLGDLNRAKRPRDGYLVEGTEPDGRRFELPGQLTGLGDGSISARILALEGGEYWPAAAITFREWLPVSNRHFGHARGSAESLSLDLSKRVLDTPLVFYLSAAYTYTDEATVDGLHEDRHRIMGAFGFEWELTESLSFSVHFWQETRRERKLFRHVDLPYGNYVQYIVFGFKFEPLPGLRIEPGAIENVLDPNTTGDFGFLLNVWYDFDAGAVIRSVTTPSRG